MIVRGLAVPGVILPAPSAIAATFVAQAGTLWEDFVQTFVKGALSGFVIGCLAAFAFAILADRTEFLRRGILPVGNFMAALPIVGTAPILVMWFGFDWHSKAAVVVVMVFFPMLVNTVAGLADTSAMQRDLMRTYGAGYVQTLVKLRLPAAMPFIFNGLKISTTLALIGAIVAEFSALRSAVSASASPPRWDSLRSTWSGRRLWSPRWRARSLRRGRRARETGHVLAPVAPALEMPGGRQDRQGGKT